MPVLAHLDAALQLAGAGEAAAIGSAVAGVAHRLSWGRSAAYTAASVGEHFVASYGYGLMTGPEGPLRAAAPRAGLVLLAPHFGYPDHRHPPREAYLVLTPGARWRVDRGAWFDVQPGTVIHHASQQWHAVRAGEAPFLGFVAWLDAARPEQIDI
jgi:quercetin dioxygenase-like cupin family protein